MVSSTIQSVLDLSKSFYARVGDDYRIYIPKEVRRVVRVEPGDTVWMIVGTVIPGGRRVLIP
jgi:bifunctional DNA-binding transcriptional regulator/antitoxin component of YhaV-PrlF toxin-antitoxin module